VKVNLQDQQTILELVGLALETSRIKSQMANSQTVIEIEKSREHLLEVSDQVIDQRNRVAELESELSRAEADLELVESRIKKDALLLNTTSSAKEAAAAEHELESLRVRKGNLEDVELGIMEDLDKARIILEEALSQKRAAEQQLIELEDQFANERLASEKSILELESRISQLSSSLQPEALTLYLAKSKRGVVAGRLLGRECGACRLSITANALDEILASPADELPECPNCQALLVRS
jgi:uncharacterized protein